MEQKYLYLSIVILSLLTSLGRADYNLPVFGLLYVCSSRLYGERRWRQQRFFLAIVVASVVFDIAYVCYWSPLWFSREWQSWTHWSYRLSAWTMWMTGLTTLVKLGTAGYMFRLEIMQMLGLKQKVDIIEEYETYKYLPVPQQNF